MRTNTGSNKKLFVAVATVLSAFALIAGTANAAQLLSASGSGVTATSGNTSCKPQTNLKNPCRALFGANASGNPGAPADSISQFNYLSSLVGHSLDVYRQYHAYPGATSNADQPPNSTEEQLASSGVTLDINWNPSKTWQEAMPVANGGSQATNDNIKQVADNIKAKLAGHTVFLSPWHEANLLVSATDPGSSESCDALSGAQRAAGTPQQFNAAWNNVFNTFKQEGVTNVVWTLNYLGDFKHRCWIPDMWPGNSEVDWVIYDTYSGQGGPSSDGSWEQTGGAVYDFLHQTSSSSMNLDSKPWGIGEYGDCNPSSETQADSYFNQMATDYQNGKYPKLKMFLAYADAYNGGMGCLSNYLNGNSTSPDPTKQKAFNALPNAIFSGTPPSTTTSTTRPTTSTTSSTTTSTTSTSTTSTSTTLPQDCNGPDAIQSASYTVNGKPVSSLDNHVQQGATININFTLKPQCHGIKVGVASYQAPGPNWNRANDAKQVLFRSDDSTFAGLGQLMVKVPNCFYQVDFFTGPALPQLSPSHDYNIPNGNLIDADNGGTVACITSTPQTLPTLPTIFG